MKSVLSIVLAFAILSACNSYDAKKQLDNAYTATLDKVAPYVIKKPDHITYEQRFDKEHKPFYDNFINATGAELKYFHHTDTADFFFFSHRDLSSLYEHYRGLGGYYKQDEQGRITFLNLLYHTPRFEKKEMASKGKELFQEMITKGNVDKYISNKKYVHTPNDDFYYDAKRNRWDYTPNSSWKFLEEAKKEAERDSLVVD